MRKLATKRTVTELKPIEGADRIELAMIDGWQIVVKKDDFKVGDSCIYFEIDSAFKADSLVGRSLDPSRLSKIYTDEGKQFEGFRIKTIKLRGQISQGFVLPLSYFKDESLLADEDQLSQNLEVYKYERPIFANSGLAPVRGDFPLHLQKTDQERIQNSIDEVYQVYLENQIHFEVSYKLDGTSMTVSRFEGDEHVCSRNLSFQLDCAYDDMTLVILGKEMLKSIEGDFTIQGELVGPSIQSNFENLAKPQFYMFSLFDVKRRENVTPSEARLFAQQHGLNYVPVLHGNMTLQALFGENLTQTELLDALLHYADGESGLKGKYREGLVYKAEQESSFSFKTISNKYLLKQA